jgi:hypothetical protein
VLRNGRPAASKVYKLIPDISVLGQSSKPRVPWWRRRQPGGIEQNVSTCGNIEKVVPLLPIHIIR